jgi:hypothetical protein
VACQRRTNAYIWGMCGRISQSRSSELHEPSHQADKCRAHKSYGPFQRIEAEKSTLGRRKCESRHRHRPLFGTIKFSSRLMGGRFNAGIHVYQRVPGAIQLVRSSGLRALEHLTKRLNRLWIHMTARIRFNIPTGTKGPVMNGEALFR